MEKQKKRANWYKTGGYESVIFVPTTPESELKRKYSKEISRNGFKIRVVELAGTSLKRLLQKSNPFKKKFCERSDCLMCRSNGKGPCDVDSVTYDLTCTECVPENSKMNTYTGETSRNTYTRGKEHLASLDNSDEGSVMWKHSKEKHGSHIPNFYMSVTGQFKNDAMKTDFRSCEHKQRGQEQCYEH